MPSTQRAQLATIDEPLIERVADCIVEACDPKAIYLFGSAARGGAGPESDLDVLIVTELADGERPYEKASELRRLFDGWLVSFDILVQSPRDFDRAKSWLGHIAYTAAREGTLLYQRSSRAHA
jgi:predicted nucleotidyltransferase